MMKHFAIICALLFFTFEIAHARLGAGRGRRSPREAAETNRPGTEARETRPEEVTGWRGVPKAPTAGPRPRSSSLDSRSNPNSYQNSQSTNNISRSTLERLRINEGRIENIDYLLNREQQRQFRDSILSLDRYVNQNTANLSNRQVELVEKLTEAVQLNPTHGFLRQTISMLEAGQITSSNEVYNITIVLNEARSFMNRTDTGNMDSLSRQLLRQDHTNALNRALFRNGYARDTRRGWCI